MKLQLYGLQMPIHLLHESTNIMLNYIHLIVNKTYTHLKPIILLHKIIIVNHY
jgi:hypothetical protein